MLKYGTAILLLICIVMMMFGCADDQDTKEAESGENAETVVETLKIGMLGL
ncbi:MAG: hypothetical protein GX363_01280, partial [Clostridiales bacterium]|nr:hypothetical protein [Clostridiales bacterium]